MKRWRSIVPALALAASCTFVADYPDTRAENDGPRCQDGRDNDLNGDTDCADTSCAGLGVCPEADQVQNTSLAPCFADTDIGVEFEFDGDVCEPWTDGDDDCDAGLVRFPGRGACEVLAPACAVDDDFAADVAADIYVGAEGAGDGTRGSPFGSLADGLAAAPVGGTIALAEGSTVTAASLSRDVTLVGCGAGSTITGPTSIDATVTLRGVAIVASGEDVAALLVPAGGVLSLRGSSVHSDDVGLLVSGVADVERVSLAAPTAARVATSGQLTARVANFSGAVDLQASSSADLRAASVSDSPAAGLEVGAAASLVLRGVVIERSGTSAIHASCGAASAPCLDAEDLVVREAASRADGVLVPEGSVRLLRVLVEGASGHGTHFGVGSAELDHVVVRNTRSDGDREGTGMVVGADSFLRASHVLLRANQPRGLVFEGGRGVLSELQVQGEQISGTQGVGLLVGEDAEVVLMGFIIHQAGLCGVTLLQGSRFSGNRGVISETFRGVCVQGADIGVAELTSNITYSQNSRNFVTDANAE